MKIELEGQRSQIRVGFLTFAAMVVFIVALLTLENFPSVSGLPVPQLLATIGCLLLILVVTEKALLPRPLARWTRTRFALRIYRRWRIRLPRSLCGGIHFRWDEVKRAGFLSFLGVTMPSHIVVRLDRPRRSFWTARGKPSRLALPVGARETQEICRVFVAHVGEGRLSPGLKAVAEGRTGVWRAARFFSLAYWPTVAALAFGLAIALRLFGPLHVAHGLFALLVLGWLGFDAGICHVFDAACGFRPGPSYWVFVTTLALSLLPMSGAVALGWVMGRECPFVFTLTVFGAISLSALWTLISKCSRRAAWLSLAPCAALSCACVLALTGLLPRPISLGPVSGILPASPWTPEGDALLTVDSPDDRETTAAWFSRDGDLLQRHRLAGKDPWLLAVGRRAALVGTTTQGDDGQHLLWWVARGQEEHKHLLTSAHWWRGFSLSPDFGAACRLSSEHGGVIVNLDDGSFRTLPGLGSPDTGLLRFDLHGGLRLVEGVTQNYRDRQRQASAKAQADEDAGPPPKPFIVWQLDLAGRRLAKLYEAEHLWQGWIASPHLRFIRASRYVPPASNKTELVWIDLDASPPATAVVRDSLLPDYSERQWGPEDDWFLTLAPTPDGRKQQPLRVRPPHERTEPVGEPLPQLGHVTFSPDGRFAATTGDIRGPRVQVFRTSDGARVRWALALDSSWAFWAPRGDALYFEILRLSFGRARKDERTIVHEAMVMQVPAD